MPRTQHYLHQPEYYPPRHPTSLYVDDPDDFVDFTDYEHQHDDYVEIKRREYLEALHQQHQKREYERAVTLENQRHRAQLAALAERESLKKRGSSNRPRSLYGPEQPQVSTLEEPARRPQSAPRSQPQSRPRLEDWHARLLEELFGIPAEYLRQQTEREPSNEAEEIPDLEDEQPMAQPTVHPEIRSAHREQPMAQPNVHPEIRSAHCPTPAQPHSAPTPRQRRAQVHPQNAPKRQEPQLESAHVPIISLSPPSDSEPDAPKRTQALTTIAEIAHTFDTLHRVFTFPAGPLEPHTHPTVDAYENALAELLTKLDAVESFGLKVVRDARRELVVKIESELDELEKRVKAARGMGEKEEKVDETVDEEGAEKPASQDVRVEDDPAIAPVEAPEAPEATETPTTQDEHVERREYTQLQAGSVLSEPANSASIPDPQTASQTAELARVSIHIITSHPDVESSTSPSVPSTADPGDVQGVGNSDCPPIEVDPTAKGSAASSISGVPPLPQKEGSDREFEML